MQIIDPDPSFPHGQITQAIKDALFQTHRELG
jgi:GxxExxY protein